jgi:uncharacterized protein YodC (DUF2158 family)
MAFRIGDVVKLKSGGPLMTVTNPGSTTGEHAVVSCSWFDGTTPHASVFPPDTLEIVENPQGSPASARYIR